MSPSLRYFSMCSAQTHQYRPRKNISNGKEPQWIGSKHFSFVFGIVYKCVPYTLYSVHSLCLVLQYMMRRSSQCKHYALHIQHTAYCMAHMAFSLQFDGTYYILHNRKKKHSQCLRITDTENLLSEKCIKFGRYDADERMLCVLWRLAPNALNISSNWCGCAVWEWHMEYIHILMTYRMYVCM